MKGAWCFWWPMGQVPMTRRRFWANALAWGAGSFGALAWCVANKGAVPVALHWVALTVALMTLVALDAALRARLRHAGWPPSLVGWALFAAAVGCFLSVRLGMAPWLAWGPAGLLVGLCLVGAMRRGRS